MFLLFHSRRVENKFTLMYLTVEGFLYITDTLSALCLCLWKWIQFNFNYLL